jgi:xanthine dehydrogenase small subunit
LNDGKVKREIQLKDYYKGYKTLNKNSEELIEKLYFELPNANTYFNFEEVNK